jgi:geranylgeranyl diphosphate synthase type II
VGRIRRVALTERMQAMRASVEAKLDEVLRARDPREARLMEAMRYSVLSGGKRVRPILCLASYEAVGGEGDEALPAAAGLELIHAYSLVHDDLPAMDNDSVRRGKPTTHRVYGEAMAVLAGDALLTLAFDVFATAPERSSVSAAGWLDVLRKVAHAAGTHGMIGGQVGDLEALNDPGNPSLIDYVHAHKTGALIAASVWVGARLGTEDAELLARLGRYGEKIGFAFQVVDDILDYGDRPDEPASYVGCHGVAGARKKAETLVREAREEIKPLGPRGRLLGEIAEFIAERAEQSSHEK